jgi:uncharacterized protein involved in exopolysaccharide biosynthesis
MSAPMQIEQPNMPASDEIDLRELFAVIWSGKIIIAAVTFLFAVVAIFYTLSVPDIYASEVTLTPADDSGNNLTGQLGGIAALAGVSFGSQAVNKTEIIIEIMKSRDFIARFIRKERIEVTLMAAHGWDKKNNKIIINPEVYDISKNVWMSGNTGDNKSEPSIQEMTDSFRNLMQINTDKLSGVVRVSFKHYSPYFAKSTLDNFIDVLNNEMRNRDLAEAEKSIKYLNEQLKKTDVSDFRLTIFSLIEEQTKKAMLANVRDDYAFKVIDPAVVPETKSEPKRLVLVVSSMLIGFFLAIVFVLVFSFASRK